MAQAENPRSVVVEEVAKARRTISMMHEIVIANGAKAIPLEVPVSDRLKGDLASYFPPVPSSSEKTFDFATQMRYIGKIGEYIDAVLRITPESQVGYGELLDEENDKDELMFTKGDFVYVYSEDDGLSLVRFTADESGQVLMQAFSFEEDGILAVGMSFEKPDLDTITFLSASDNKPSTINFVEDVLSDLSPGVVTGFNGRDLMSVSASSLQSMRDEFRNSNRSSSAESGDDSPSEKNDVEKSK